MLEEKFVKAETKHTGNIIRFETVTVELPNGKLATRDVIRHPGAAVVIPINDNAETYIVKQYRAAIGKILIEFPAGKLDKEGEDPLEAAKRELREETGLKSNNIRHITSFYSAPGFCDELLHMYVATELEEGLSEVDEDEFLECEKIKVEKLVEMVKNKEITDSKTIMGVFFAEKIIKGEY